MPLGIKEIKISKIQKKNIDTKSAAIRLLKFENELYMDKLQKGRKRKKNKQLMQNNENNKSSEEELENISDENNSKSESTEIDENEIIKKKRKLKHKLNTINYLTDTNLQISDKNSLNMKKTKYKIIEKNQNQNIYKSNLKNNYKRKNHLLIENIHENKKIKLKKSKNTTVKTLNIITQAKRKKSTKLKNTGKWNVSDHVEAPICSLNNNTKSFQNNSKIVDNSVINNHEQENILNKKPIWLMPILTKLKNERNVSSVIFISVIN